MTPEQGLARLEAIEDIRQLRTRYFHACDSKQLEIVCECFPEGEVELRYGHIVEMHHGQNALSSRGDFHATI
ncbi:MAG: nuclear transport factor 2 family protein [Halioglobus sp.]|nr:nuclear transport factor 2 family protein [Halioglobus sp.]